MKSVVHNKIGASLLVIAGFAIWLEGSQLIPRASIWNETIGFAIGAFAFFLVGCFLPENKTATFLSRQSALGLMAAFLWLGSARLIRLLFHSDITARHLNDIAVLVSIGIGVLSYWTAIFLIRGMRAAPEYLSHPEPLVEADPAPAVPPTAPAQSAR